MALRIKDGYSFKADAVANEFLVIPGAANSVTPMKLQKLVYFAHGWYLGLTDMPLVAEPIQAWKYGPVIQSIYREFKGFGSDFISRLARDVRPVGDDDVEECTPRVADTAVDAPFVTDLISRMWKLYGKHTAAELSTMTHQAGTPWHTIYSKFNRNGQIYSGIDIPNELIRDYFKKQLRKPT